jgi:hypothetical protein
MTIYEREQALVSTLEQLVKCLDYAVDALEAPPRSSIREDLADAKALLSQVKQEMQA